MNRASPPAAAISAKFGDDVRMGNTSMWFSYTNDVVLQGNADLSPSLIGVAALPAGPAGTSNEINAGMWAINAQVKDPKKLEACWKFIKFFAGDEVTQHASDAAMSFRKFDHAFGKRSAPEVSIKSPPHLRRTPQLSAEVFAPR